VRAFCPLCTASAAVLAGLAFTTARADKFAANPAFTGRLGFAWILGFVALLLASPQIASALAAREEILAIVDGQRLTRTQMEKEIGGSLEPSQRSIYQLELDWVCKKVDDSLLANEARARDTTVEALLQTRPGNRAQLLAELAKKHRIQVFLRAPKVRWLKVDLSTAKLSGPTDAPVQIIVFSDFECHFCAELATVLKRIRAEFPDKVLVGYRYFPIESHARAVPAAIAAECAAEQGKFWEYHDKLFAERGDLSDAVLLNAALAIGLDRDQFVRCQSAGLAREVVENSRKEAEELGLEGAPTIALNGRVIGGMVSYEKLVAEVRKALNTAAAARTSNR
jgi:predicted DsbA family dithiol-disulfide isomerase